MNTLITPIGDRARQAVAIESIRTARIALLGCGTIGREVARVLIDQGGQLGRRAGVRLELARILVRSPSRPRGIAPELFTGTIDHILADSPDVLIEALGGIEPAATYIEAALRRGIAVVTANKSLIARHGRRLAEIAAAHGAAIACEASVCAAIPVLAALRQLAGDRVRAVHGVINGTCNFILTRMTDAGLPFDRAVSEANEKGLAEPDPQADLSGLDSAEKLCVLAGAIGHALAPQQVQTTGIEAVTPRDIAAATSLGYVIKLIAALTLDERGAGHARVGPTLVRRRHPLAQPSGAENAVVIDSELGGRLLLQGVGAGPRATASALLGDVVRVLRSEHGKLTLPPPTSQPDAGRPGACRWLMCIEGSACALRPDPVLSRFNTHGVGIDHIAFHRDSVQSLTATVDPDRVASLLRDLEGNRLQTTARAFPILE
jgi:homoserine dehydrogenase